MLDRTKAYFISLSKHPSDGKMVGVFRTNVSGDQTYFEKLDVVKKSWERLSATYVDENGKTRYFIPRTLTPGSLEQGVTKPTSIPIDQDALFNQRDGEAGVLEAINEHSSEIIRMWYKYVALYEIIIQKAAPILKEMDERESIV
jgi:hypothetical protein